MFFVIGLDLLESIEAKYVGFLVKLVDIGVILRSEFQRILPSATIECCLTFFYTPDFPHDLVKCLHCYLPTELS